jgi:hypothetical protein
MGNAEIKSCEAHDRAIDLSGTRLAFGRNVSYPLIVFDAMKISRRKYEA